MRLSIGHHRVCLRVEGVEAKSLYSAGVTVIKDVLESDRRFRMLA